MVSEMIIVRASPCKTGYFYKHVKQRPLPNGGVQTHFYFLKDDAKFTAFLNTTKDGRHEKGVHARCLQSRTALERFCMSETFASGASDDHALRQNAIATLASMFERPVVFKVKTKRLSDFY
jgi:hypothetical protein